MLVLLGAGANPSATNSCGFSPGSCFLHPVGSMPRAGVGTSLAANTNVFDICRALQEHRKRLGQVRRLADATAKRLVVAAVADRAMASVHRFVEFALKVIFFLFLGRASWPPLVVVVCIVPDCRCTRQVEDVPVGYSCFQVGEPGARRCLRSCKAEESHHFRFFFSGKENRSALPSFNEEKD